MKISRKKKAFIVIVLIFSLIGVGFTCFNLQVGRLIRDTAQAVIESNVSRMSNESVLNIIGGSSKYMNLVELKTDESGQITYLGADSVKMNALARDAAMELQEELEEYSSQKVALKLGAVLGIDMFAGSGPSIYITVHPIGSITTEYISEFANAGINQTRHRVYLSVSTQLRVIMPTGSMAVTVRTQIAVSECIIVGRVPDSYVNVADMDQMLNLIP